MSATLRLVPLEPFGYYPPWCARSFCNGHDHSESCCFCGRAVAVPRDAIGKNVACVFCGWERGEVPTEEVEP